MTNLVLTFSEHFGRTLTRTPGTPSPWWPVVTNGGVLGVLVGLAGHRPWLIGLGATILTAVVLCSYRRLRRMRREALGARFGWIVRLYERAHGAFLHGAVLGALLGLGLVPGDWYLGVRVAHLHANVLGWGGLTLLATLVFFGPTMARTRIAPGADDRAAVALRVGACGLSAAVLLLIPAGLAGAPGLVARLGASLGLAVLAWAAACVCLPVARVAAAARPTGPRWLIVAVGVWLPLVLVADVVLVAAGAWRWLGVLGAAALAGVLGQAVLATLLYLAPMLRRGAGEARDGVRRRLDVGAVPRAVAFQVATLLLVLAALPAPWRLPVAGAGWALLGGILVVTGLAALLPARSGPGSTPPAAR